MAAIASDPTAPPAAARPPALLVPVDGLLSRLPTSARLAALVVLLLVPAALANVAYTRTITGQLNFSLAERDGVRVLQPTLTAMAATVAGRVPDLAAVEAAVTAEPGLELTDHWQAVHTAGQALSAAGTPESAASAAARTTLVRALSDLVTEAGNSSNLILDPDLDSFYVMDILVVQLPRMLLTAAQSASPDATISRTDQVAAQAVRAGTLTGALEAVISDGRTARANTADPALTGRLKALDGATKAGAAMATHLTSTLGAPAPARPAAVGAATISAVPDTVTALDELLRARTDRLARERLMTLVVSFAALAVACWFAAGVWWRTRRDVALVLGAVTAIAEDDLEPRQVPEGREEFGRIGRALAVARHQLGEAQAALSLSEAAREEQTQANFAQQRVAERQVRERAQEVIDSTAETVVNNLGEVVTQVDAVRASTTTIDDKVAAADTAARDVVDQAKEADRLVTALASSLDQVAGMAALIAGIADQTRLLALNATIESARAGEAGRGFSVVAQEVKNLAVTTARSTERITQTISSLQRDAEAVATSITMMNQGILEVDEATEVLSGVATDQHALVQRLDQSVTEAINRIGAMAQLTEKLERRVHERIPTVGDVELRHDGHVIMASLADISEGGVRCRVPDAQAPRMGDTVEARLQLADGPVALPARVVRVVHRQDSVQLGMEFVDLQPGTDRRLQEHVASLAPTFTASTSG